MSKHKSLIVICPICDNPIGCAVKEDQFRFCGKCQSQGQCIVGNVYYSGAWTGEVDKTLTHAKCKDELCLESVLYVAT